MIVGRHPKKPGCVIQQKQTDQSARHGNPGDGKMRCRFDRPDENGCAEQKQRGPDVTPGKMQRLNRCYQQILFREREGNGKPHQQEPVYSTERVGTTPAGDDADRCEQGHRAIGRKQARNRQHPGQRPLLL